MKNVRFIGKKHFDDIVSDEIVHSTEDSFRVDYFLYILD